jgi:predicted AAA+ superfamily ATPase
MAAELRIAYNDLDAHPLVRAITDAAAHPSDEHAARQLAGALFSLNSTVPIALAELVLGSRGAFATLARGGVSGTDRRFGRADAELADLGGLAHADLVGMLDHHGLADAVPPEAALRMQGRPPAFLELCRHLAETADWGSSVRTLAAFYRAEGVGELATHRVLRFSHGELVGIAHPDPISPADLIGSDHSRAPLAQALAAFVRGGPANDALLYGPPGTGKSASVRALAAGNAEDGLRLIQVDRSDAATITALFACLEGAGPRCLVLLDDLVFDDAQRTDRTLRAALDGDAAMRPTNVVVWATSNRLKLMRETRSEREDDLESALGRGEKAALATRFGLRVAFTELTQDRYIEIARGLVARFGGEVTEGLTPSAVRFARGGHGLTPRTARQFAVAWCAGTVRPLPAAS